EQGEDGAHRDREDQRGHQIEAQDVEEPEQCPREGGPQKGQQGTASAVPAGARADGSGAHPVCGDHRGPPSWSPDEGVPAGVGELPSVRDALVPGAEDTVVSVAPAVSAVSARRRWLARSCWWMALTISTARAPSSRPTGCRENRA